MKNPSWILLENGLYLIHNLSDEELNNLKKHSETTFIWEIKRKEAIKHQLKKEDSALSGTPL